MRFWGIGTPALNYGYLSKFIFGGGGNECTLFAFGNNDPAPAVKKTGGTSYVAVYRAPLIATEIPIPVTTAPVTISVPYGVNASIQAPAPTPVPDVPNTVQTTLPQVEVVASTLIGNVRVTIPSGTTVTAPAGWNGAISCLIR